VVRVNRPFRAILANLRDFSSTFSNEKFKHQKPNIEDPNTK
jgi:hypothetical protein